VREREFVMVVIVGFAGRDLVCLNIPLKTKP